MQFSPVKLHVGGRSYKTSLTLQVVFQYYGHFCTVVVIAQASEPRPTESFRSGNSSHSAVG